MENSNKIFEDIQNILNVLETNSLKKNYDLVSYNKELSTLKCLLERLQNNYKFYQNEYSINNHFKGDRLDNSFKSDRKYEIVRIKERSKVEFKKSQLYEEQTIEDIYREMLEEEFMLRMEHNVDIDIDNIEPYPEGDKLMVEMYIRINKPEYKFKEEVESFCFKIRKPVEEGTRNWGEFSCRVWSYYFFYIYCIGTIIYKTPFPLSSIYKVTLVEPFKYIDHPMLKTSKEFGTPRQFFIKIWGISLYNSYMSILREDSYFENKVLEANCEIHLESLKVASFLLHINGYEEAAQLAKEVFLDTNI